MSTMVTLFSALPESVLSGMSEEAIEASKLHLIPALVPAKEKKLSPRAATVAALSAFDTAKARREYLSDKLGTGVYPVHGAVKSEIGQSFDAAAANGEKLDVSGIDKDEILAGIAFKKGEKVVVVTTLAAASLVLNQINKVEKAKAEYGRRSIEAREAIRVLHGMKEQAAA